MNEDEVINRLKQSIDFNSSLYIDDLGDNDIKIILNLIEKQQKEIEEKIITINKMSKDISRQLKEIEKLNFENHMIKKWNERLDKNCISKDKIREKIKEYDKWIKQGEYIESLEAQKYALEELLKENIKEENS